MVNNNKYYFPLQHRQGIYIIGEFDKLDSEYRLQSWGILTIRILIILSGNFDDGNIDNIVNINNFLETF